MAEKGGGLRLRRWSGGAAGPRTLAPVNGRNGWLVVIGVAVVWDVLAAVNNRESLTGFFRCSVAQTAWRWPVLAVIVLLLVHLFLPPSLQKYDPLDRLYYRVNPAASGQTPTFDQPCDPDNPSV
jgi:hypothetical protein